MANRPPPVGDEEFPFSLAKPSVRSVGNAHSTG